MAETEWLLFDGTQLVGQVKTHGKTTPSEDGSNPHGFREEKAKHTKDIEGEDFDPIKKRWQQTDNKLEEKRQRSKAHAQAWLDALPEGVIDLLVELVKASLEQEDKP